MSAMRRAWFSGFTCFFAVVAACGGEPTPPAQAYVTSNSDYAVGSETLCPTSPSDWIIIGTSSKSVADAATQNGAAVTVYCRVAPLKAGGFDVEARVQIKGDNGGTVQILGTLVGGKAEKVAATFQKGSYGNFNQSDCTFDYSSNPNMGIAEGRVWGRVDCGKAVDSSGRRVGNPPATAVCKFFGELKFENCARSADGS